MIRIPKNESEVHFRLKEIAKYILFVWGYKRIASEVSDMWAFDFKNTEKSVIDVVGAKIIKKRVEGVGYNIGYDLRGIEAKVSLSDFKNGFCAAPSNTYIIAPKYVLSANIIPDNVGLIEVDLDNFSTKRYITKLDDIKGIRITKKAKKRIDKRFGNMDNYRSWCDRILDQIAYRNTIEMLFWRNYIEFENKKG